MRILVINAGSSSLKLAVLDPTSGARAADVRIERVGTPEASLQAGEHRAPCACADHREALLAAMAHLGDPTAIDAVVHRVVHGGDAFNRPVRVTEEVVAKIEALIPLAPLHNPANVAGIRAAQAALPNALHLAVFDTAFHATLPRRAKTYAVAPELRERIGLQRYGFHGPSHAYVAGAVAEAMETPLRDLRVITCHLGNGASVCAVEYGRSVETSMGFTPLEGLVMGTRSGDLDPGALIALLRDGMSVDALDDALQRRSGLAGLSGVGNDMRDIEERAAEGDDACRLALHVFAHRVRKYVGAYAAVRGGVDAIAFAGGIGQNSSLIRHRVCQRLDFLGARLSEDLNRDARATAATPVLPIDERSSRVRLFAVHTDEEWQMARHAADLLSDRDAVDHALTIPVAVSARHVHLRQETVEALFGPGATLTVDRPLTQPGQFAAVERVDLIGPKRTIEGVRVLGPVRGADQVEVSATDEFTLGIDAPVRASGHTQNSPGITLRGPAGTVTLKEGVICAWRHIHMTPEDAERFGVQDKDVVDVGLETDGRTLIFGDVLVRVKASYALEMHIDTDEANAAGIGRGGTGVLVGDAGTAQLERRRTR